MPLIIFSFIYESQLLTCYLACNQLQVNFWIIFRGEGYFFVYGGRMIALGIGFLNCFCDLN